MDGRTIEEMIRDAEQAKEPGTLGQVVHQQNEELPVNIDAPKVKSAGYVYIYDTVTRERSLTNRNMLPTQLNKKRSDGTTVFTTVKPSEPPVRGNLKCMLHPDSPDRKYYDRLGLVTCKKSNLVSAFQVKRHMQKRHPMEWATIEEDRKAKEKAEEKEFQRLILAKSLEQGIKLQEKADSTPKDYTEQPALDYDNAEIYVSDKPAKEKTKKRKHRR